jgi:SepF-like predicted cell division protein (DUF552 family)
MERKGGKDSLEQVFADLANEVKVRTDKQKEYLSERYLHTTLKRVLLDLGLTPDKTFVEIQADILNAAPEIQARAACKQFLIALEEYKKYLYLRAFDKINELRVEDPDWFTVRFGQIGFANVFDNPIWNLQPKDKLPADPNRFELLGPSDSIFANSDKQQKRKADELLDGEMQIIRLAQATQPREVILQHVELKKQRTEMSHRLSRLKTGIVQPLKSQIKVAGVVLRKADPTAIWQQLLDLRPVCEEVIRVEIAKWHADLKAEGLKDAVSEEEERVALLDSRIAGFRNSRLPVHEKALSSDRMNGLAAELKEWSKNAYRTEWHKQICDGLVVRQLLNPLEELHKRLMMIGNDEVEEEGNDHDTKRSSKRQRKTASLPDYMQSLEISEQQQHLSLDQWIKDLKAFHEAYAARPPPENKVALEKLKDTRKQIYQAAANIDAGNYVVSFLTLLKQNPHLADKPAPRIETVPLEATTAVVKFEHQLLIATAKEINDQSHSAHEFIVESILAKHAACIARYDKLADGLQKRMTQVQTTLSPFEPWMMEVPIADKFRIRFSQLTGVPHKSIPQTLAGVLAECQRWFDQQRCQK